jgi:2-dehydro-3-deoxyphosphogluconate aldolase/(4S)-4-hydroxy-2-oxoglutarate aldolase
VTKLDILKRLTDAQVVAILRFVDPDKVGYTVDALLEGGITALEVTLNSPGALDQIRAAVAACGDRAVVGAGTVLDGAAAVNAIMAGAQFLVAPNLKDEVLRAAGRYGIPALPGAMTPTEIEAAAEAGADIVKVFPAGTLGPRYFKEVKAPLGHITLMATGGITVENAAEFIRNGADLVGVGGQLVNQELIAQGRWSEISDRARRIIDAVGSAK